MNELQEFFQSVAIEKKKVAEEQARIQAREERLKPQVNIELNDLSEFFGLCACARPRPKTLHDAVTPPKPEEQKMHLELESFFNRLSSFENALEEQITKPKVDEKVEEVKEEKSNTQLLADAMSKYTKGVPETITEEPSELDKIKEEFRHFKEQVIKQMASIGGGGEVNLLKLDDVDTGALGDGKVLKYNASTGKLVFATDSSATTLTALTDVDDTDLADDSIMQYNSSTGKFEFVNEIDGGTV
tara:strand:- start:85 stop:816 length:732 start_codon:yes stop_codon:yes gene_type:complete